MNITLPQIALGTLALALLLIVAGCGGGSSNSGQQSQSTGYPAFVVTGPAHSRQIATATKTIAASTPVTLTLMAGPTVLALGQSAQLTWLSSGAASVATSNFDASTTTGAQIVTPSHTTTYTITVRGPGGSKTALTTVVVGLPISVKISPNPVTLASGDTRQFTALVSNSPNTAVLWKVWGSNSGTITANGVYFAPPTPNVYYVTATSIADPSKSDTAALTVR